MQRPKLSAKTATRNVRLVDRSGGASNGSVSWSWIRMRTLSSDISMGSGTRVSARPPARPGDRERSRYERSRTGSRDDDIVR